MTCVSSSLVKDKAEILLQVEELLHIKEELSSQVCHSKIETMRGVAYWTIVHLCAIIFLR